MDERCRLAEGIAVRGHRCRERVAAASISALKPTATQQQCRYCAPILWADSRHASIAHGILSGFHTRSSAAAP
jgi:hypothetical protein